MARTPEERELAAREAEIDRLLLEARATHRAADRERGRARRLTGRIARKLKHALDTARSQIDTDRAAIDARIARFAEAQSAFHTASLADRDALRAAWAELEAERSRLVAEWDETNRFHADQAATLDARAADLARRERADGDARAAAQHQAAALREEVAALDARARAARQLVDELEHRRAELRAELLAPAAGTDAAPPPELEVALDRRADRDLGQWAAELDRRERLLDRERDAVQGLFAAVSKDKAGLGDERRVLAEQHAQLAVARARWQEAERATVEEMEHLARTLRRREAELDARQERLLRADARRRAEGYDLWQLRLRLEAWQSKIVAYEMRWHTEREAMEAEFDRREAALARRERSPSGTAAEAENDPIPFASVVPEEPVAIPAELAALREELERLAEVMLEAELPEPPDPPESELPWASDDLSPAAREPEPDDAEVLLFEPPARAA